MKKNVFSTYVISTLLAAIHLQVLQGQQWELLRASAPLSDIWVLDEQRAWAVGRRGHILSTEDGGTSWAHRITLPNHIGLTNVWGLDASHIWAVGHEGRIVFFDGQTWWHQSTPQTIRLYDVWASSASDVWIVADLGRIYHNNGTEWYLHSNVGFTLRSIWGTDASNIWAAGDGGRIYKYDGNTWAQQISDGGIFAQIWGLDGNNIWAVGSNGRILKYDGNEWQHQASNTSQTISGVYATQPDNVWASTSLGFLRYDGASWDWENWNSIGAISITGAGPHNIWAISTYPHHVIHHNGTDWDTRFFADDGLIRNITGVNDSNAWALSFNNTLYRFDGEEWNVQEKLSGLGVNNIYALSTQSIWAVGAFGSIRQYDGNTWQTHDSGVTAWLNAVWAADTSNVWAVGRDGHILHYDGNTWSAQVIDPDLHFTDVLGFSPTDVWAVAFPAIAHFDGTSWEIAAVVEPAPFGSGFLSGTGPDNLWLLSGRNLWKYEGGDWVHLTILHFPSITISRFWVQDATNIWFAGVDGIDHHGRVVHYDGNDLHIYTLPGGLDPTAIWGAGSKILVGGHWGYFWSANFTPVSTSEPFAPGDNQWSVYPNPASDILHINSNGQALLHYEVYDNMGRLLRNGVPDANTLSLEGLPSGLYVLALQSATERIVKKVMKR